MIRHKAFSLAVGLMVLWTLASSSIANAAGHKVVVYLKAERVQVTATEMAQKLDAGDVGLAASLAFPLSSRPTVRMPNSAGEMLAPVGSARDRLGRYLTLEYPLTVDIDQVVTDLKNDDRLGYVAIDETGAWSAVPNDTYYQIPFSPPDPRYPQWAFQQLNLENAWDRSKGYALIGLSDSGIELAHPELQKNYRPHHSWDFKDDDADPNEEGTAKGHGTHIAGIVGAEANNQAGVTSTCWNCSLLIARGPSISQRLEGLFYLAENGAQIVNMSGGFPETPCATTPPSQQSPYCPFIEWLEDREVIFTASSGNNRQGIDFPASEPSTIAVGGTVNGGGFWDDGDVGSNSGPEQDFAAPAKQVLSTFFHGALWNPGLGCSDDPANPNTRDLLGTFHPPLGIETCTGTSMSAPFVAGIFAHVRSANPLLSVADSKQALIDTASQMGIHDEDLGYGIPDTLGAIERTLGEVDGNVVTNRLTPMFSLFSPVVNDFLYTSKPQVASAAIVGSLHELPTSTATVSYTSANVGSPVAGYGAFPLEPGTTNPQPRSSFSVFTGEHNPFDSATPLVPLYRLSFTAGCDPRDHVYTTEQAGIDFFISGDWCPNEPGDQVFRLDGIEGYILSECPPGFSCNNNSDATEPQCVHRRFSTPDNGWALILESELGQAPYQNYTGVAGNSCIGYVFANDDSDGDGLTDGSEIVVGTDPSIADSDCDGSSDSIELPLAALPVSDPLIADSGTGCDCQEIHSDGFDDGTFNAWAQALTAGIGSIAVDASAAQSGPFGMSSKISGLGDRSFVVDTTPSGEKRYRAGFDLRVADVDMTAGKTHRIFVGRDDLAGVTILLIDFSRIGDVFNVRAQTRLNDNTWAKTPWVPIGHINGRPLPHDLEVELLVSAGSILPNGLLRFTVDETVHQLAALDNSSRQIDEARLGQISGIDAGTASLLYFDTFTSCRP